MLLAHRVRTSLVLAAAGATVLTALLLTMRGGPPPASASWSDDGMILTARLTTARVLAGTHDHDVAITITAPIAHHAQRPAVSLAVVIDRSGSMSGEPIANARSAASRLIGALDPGDAFTVITYSSSAEVVMPMVRATVANKAAARAEIARIYEDGGTCISCGLVRASSELARSPIDVGVRRIVLISDGQANEGIYDRGELADLVASTAANGVSISSIGVGLDFDEVTMQHIAEVGRGNYYFVEDTQHLAALFERELSGMTETVASDVRLVLDDAAGTRIEEAYGYPISRSGSSVVIPIADLRAGETRKVVVRVAVDAPSPGPLLVARVHLGWRRVSDGVQRGAATVADAEVVTDPDAVAASADRVAIQAVEEALAAHALQRAAAVYETQGAGAANAVLQQRLDDVRANKWAEPATIDRIDRATGEAMDSYRNAAPAKARKVSGAAAYELAR